MDGKPPISYYGEKRPGVFAITMPDGRHHDFDAPTLAQAWVHLYLEAHKRAAADELKTATASPGATDGPPGAS